MTKRKMQPLVVSKGRPFSWTPSLWHPLHKQVIEEFCPRFAPGATPLFARSGADHSVYFDAVRMKRLGIMFPWISPCPDFVICDTRRKWLVLIEAVTLGDPIDRNRREELKELFTDSNVALIFVTAFSSRDAMSAFLPQISWKSAVWVAESPDHMIHFNGERCFAPYHDAMPAQLRGQDT